MYSGSLSPPPLPGGLSGRRADFLVGAAAGRHGQPAASPPPQLPVKLGWARFHVPKPKDSWGCQESSIKGGGSSSSSPHLKTLWGGP